ncbi:MAG: hypothetical protein OXR73_33155 [Myxococcales bacterium]|nr:hypothetical protein [Myxococcales bacterium]
MPAWLPILFAAPGAGALMGLLLYRTHLWRPLGPFRIWPLFVGLCVLPLSAVGGEGVRDAVFVYFWALAIAFFVDAGCRLFAWVRHGPKRQRLPALFDLAVLATFYLALLATEVATGSLACEPYQHPFPRDLPAGLDSLECRWPLSDANHIQVDGDFIRIGAYMRGASDQPSAHQSERPQAVSEVDLQIHPSAEGCRAEGSGGYIDPEGPSGRPELVLCRDQCRRHYHSLTVMVRHRCDLADDGALKLAPLRAL